MILSKQSIESPFCNLITVIEIQHVLCPQATTALKCLETNDKSDLNDIKCEPD